MDYSRLVHLAFYSIDIFILKPRVVSIKFIVMKGRLESHITHCIAYFDMITVIARCLDTPLYIRLHRSSSARIRKCSPTFSYRLRTWPWQVRKAPLEALIYSRLRSPLPNLESVLPVSQGGHPLSSTLTHSHSDN